MLEIGLYKEDVHKTYTVMKRAQLPMHDTDMIHVVYSIYSLSFMGISEQHTVWIGVYSYFNLLYLIKLLIIV